MLVYFAFVDRVAVATSAIGLLWLPAKSKVSHTRIVRFLVSKQAGQLCMKITLRPTPVKLYKFIRRITNVVELCS